MPADPALHQLQLSFRLLFRLTYGYWAAIFIFIFSSSIGFGSELTNKNVRHSRKPEPLAAMQPQTIMLRQILTILIFAFLTICASAQIESLPLLKENLPKDLKEKDWLLDILKTNYQEFISVSSNSVWSDKDYVQVIASRNDSAFAGTIIRSSIDTATIQLRIKPIDSKIYNQVIDTLTSLGFFELKDENKVSPCEHQKKEMVDGKKVTTFTRTSFITDGVHTNFFMYAKGVLRFAGYYQLDEVKNICPQSLIWKRVVAIDNYIDSFIKKHGS